MNLIFEKKIKSFKSRLLKKKYQYRQFNTSNGIWLKLKIYIVLADRILGVKYHNFEVIKNSFSNNIIGNLSSLNNDKLFLNYNNDMDNIFINYNELDFDLHKILKSDYNIIIFII